MTNTAGVLFDELSTLKAFTYKEALQIARWYEQRERTHTIPYNDPVKGKGQLTVTSMGIINRS